MNIIEKIKRLRALSQSSNVHEAANAAAAAEKLIQEHNLSEAELETPQERDVYTGEVLDTFGKRLPSWKAVLAVVLRKAYQCKELVTPGKILIYGRPQDIEMVKYQYAWFTLEIERLAQSQAMGRGKGYSTSFRHGAVSAIAEAMNEANRAARAEHTSSALVKVDERADLARARMALDFPRTAPRQGARISDNGGFAHGKRAGASLNQRTALGQGGVRLLGS